MHVNLTAPCNQLGLGVVGLNLLAHAPDCGMEVAYFPIGPSEAPPRHTDVVRRSRDRASAYDPLAPSVRYWHPNDLCHHVGKGLRVGYTIFEADEFGPDVRHQLSQQDLVLVPSAWAARVCEANGLKPSRVRVVNHGVDPSVFYPLPLPSSGPTVFYLTGKFEIRKGHLEAGEAFNQAFTPADDVKLVVHCHNPFLEDSEQKEWVDYFLNSPMGQAGKIEMVGGRYRTQEEVAHLVSTVHCGVFPSRAEGWNLPLLECLAMGRHVIATDYSAHTEFLTPECARLVGVDRLEPAYDGKWFHGKGRWARMGPPQVEQIIWHMRHIHQARVEGKLGLNRAGADRAAAFHWRRACEQLRTTLFG